MENKRPYDKEAYSCIPDPKFVPSPFGELSLGSVSLAEMCCDMKGTSKVDPMAKKIISAEQADLKKAKRS
jgi:hypothetical protein